MGNTLKKDDIDDRLGITDRERKAVKRSWHQFCKLHPNAGELIFVAMFTKHPEYLILFPPFQDKTLDELEGDPKFKAHATIVAHQLTAIVDTLDDTSILIELLRKNALNHTRLEGVTPSHLESLTHIITDVMRTKLGSRMTRATAASWDRVFEVRRVVSFKSKGDCTKAYICANAGTLRSVLF